MKKKVKMKVVITMSKKEMDILYNILNTVKENCKDLHGNAFRLLDDEKQFINDYLNIHHKDADLP